MSLKREPMTVCPFHLATRVSLQRLRPQPAAKPDGLKRPNQSKMASATGDGAIVTDVRKNSVVDDPTVFQSHNPVAVGGIRFGVRYLDDGRPLIVQALEQFHDL